MLAGGPQANRSSPSDSRSSRADDRSSRRTTRSSHGPAYGRHRRRTVLRRRARTSRYGDQNMADETRPIMLAPAADPAPLGLGAFALTTFLLSAANAGWMGSASGDAWLGYAFAYGGLGQLLAGMWEFRNRNVFGATAFSSYGGFWIGVGIWVIFVAGHQPAGSPAIGKDIAWILLAFAIFNTYMLIWSAMLNMAGFMVFLTLELT